jgi:pyruvate,orthophosphate dikinase
MAKKVVKTETEKVAKLAKPGKYVYYFGDGKADGDRTMKDLLGGKGSGLAEMTNAKLPVPAGFTISTPVCTIYYKEGGKIPAAIDKEMIDNLRKLEKSAGRKLGDTKNPLLVSVRSGAKFSMPGMMDTILNLGLNDETVESLKQETGNGRFAADSYRRFIQMFGNVVLEIPKDVFEHELDAVKKSRGVKADTDLDEKALREVIERYKKVVKNKTGKDFPQDPIEQLKGSRNAVFRSWQNPRAKEYRRIYDIPDYIGTAVNVQQMVFGNTGDRSATGVGFTRSPATGAKEFYGEFLVNAQGEDVVSGVRTPQQIKELEKVLPKAYKQLREITTRLEKHYKDVQDFEFTIQDEKLYMLQTRSGKRTGYAAVVIATDLANEKIVTPKEALLLVDPEALSQLLSPGFDPAEWAKVPILAKGLPASPGAASGQVVFTADDAVEWTRQGKQVILVRKETVPDDIHGMHVAQGILTATGGMTSHAAVVGRQMGKPSIVGAGSLTISEKDKQFTVGGKVVKEGEFVSFDGLKGEIKLGKMASKPSEILQVVNGQLAAKKSDIYQRFSKILEWADKVRRLGIRANADLPDQAELAYAFGARGIGLCRTEHMFFGEDRLPIVQRMILADNVTDRKKAVLELLPLQRADFYGVFKAMKGQPVTIRTIDPPLHEFLPKREDLMVEVAKLEATNGDKRELESKRKLLARVEQLHEFNPDARAPRGAPRHHVSRDHRDADAGHHRSGDSAEERRAEGHPRNHDPARRPCEGAEGPEGGRRSRGGRDDEGARGQDRLPCGHDDRSAARSPDRRRDCRRSPVFLVRHKRSHADDVRVLARRHRQVPRRVSGQEDPGQRPVQHHRYGRRRLARPDRGREGPRDTSRHQVGHLRGAWRRSLVDSLLREGRPELRVYVPLPCACCSPGCRTGCALGQGW